jgi:hypothetical protein
VGRGSPGEEADQSVLEDEDNADTSVEPAEVVGHQWEREGWSSDIIRRASINGDVIGSIIVDVF